MLSTLLSILITAFVLYIVYYLVGMFIKGRPLSIIGLVLGIIFLVSVLRAFNIVAI